MKVTPSELTEEIRAEISRFINEEPDPYHEGSRPWTMDAHDINTGRCRLFAELVYRNLGCPDNVCIKSLGEQHTWLELDGKAYDSVHPDGVAEYTELDTVIGMKQDGMDISSPNCGFPDDREQRTDW